MNQMFPRKPARLFTSRGLLSPSTERIASDSSALILQAVSESSRQAVRLKRWANVLLHPAVAKTPLRYRLAGGG